MKPNTRKALKNIALAYFLLMCAAGIGLSLAAAYNHYTGQDHEITTQRSPR